MKIKDEIINYLIKNRVSSVEVADALGKAGVLEGLESLNKGQYITGEIEYVFTYDGSNWPVHQQVAEIPENRIVYVDTFNCQNKAVFGDIVSKYLMLYKRSKAVVVNGYLRDIHWLRKENYPIWLKGGTPLGCSNKEVKITEEILAESNKRKELFTGSILVADDSGCTMIKKELLNKDLLDKLEFIELQEDIWYFCVDTLKMNTFQTICLKEYLTNDALLPDTLKERLSKFNLN